MEELELLQSQLDVQKKTLERVDDSIRHLNVTDKDLRREEESNRSIKRVVSLGSRSKREHSPDNRNSDAANSLKRKFSEEVPRRVRKSDLNDNRSESDDDDHHSSKIQVKSSVVSSNMPIKSKEDLIKIQNKFTGSEQRNKRIIGVILGTLRQFKNEDKERSNTTQAINRKELEKKIEIKKVEEKKRIIEEKKKLEDEKSIALNKVRILEEKILLTKEFAIWKTNQLQYKNFIRTKTKPFVFYLPKELEAKSSSLLEETALLIDDQIAKKLKITEDEIKRLQAEEDRLNANENDIENKENNKLVAPKKENQDDSSESEMDEEKNTIVRIGDEDEEDETNNHKNLKEEIPSSTNEATAAADPEEKIDETLDSKMDTTEPTAESTVDSS